MKKTILTVLVLGSLFTALIPAFAETVFQSGENYSFRKGDSTTGDLYAVGGNTTIAGNVLGDLVSIGFNVFLGGNVISEDAFIIADSANIISNVEKTLRVIARKVLVSGSIGKDAAFVGWRVDILPQSIIEGDLLATGGNIDLLGRVNGNVKIAAGSVYINETVGGDVSITADSVSLGPNALIEGDLSYSASEELTMADGAKIYGTNTFSQINTKTKAERILPTVWGTLVIIKFIVLLISALVAHGILRKISERFVVVSINEFGWSILRGFVLLVAVPVAVFIGTLTFVAIPFSLFALALYCIGIILALVYAPIVIGSIAYRLAHRHEQIKVTWKTIVLGIVISIILGYIPYVGTVIWYLMVVLALGGIYQVLFDKFSEVR